MSTPYRTTRRVEFVDTDMAGIMHFSNFFRWMESAEVEFLRVRGLSVRMHWQGEEIGLPRVHADCDYFKPVRFQDEVTIAVLVEQVGTKSITYRHEFFKEGELVARGRITACCCRVGADRQLEALEIPPQLRVLLQQ